MALKLFPVVYCCGWQGWKWIDFRHFYAAMSSQITNKNIINGLLSLTVFIWYFPQSITGAFCVWVKALGNDFSTELT